MNNMKNIVLAAAVAGLVTGAVTTANAKDAKKAKGAAHAEKNCKGKSCKGEKAAAAPAEAAPAAPAAATPAPAAH